ncbi:MAG: hypothetical protein ACD_7C00029G0001 [uncultured bacterium]|nr:MAG: hypothetical protein ACD_7C00029G0001 [uncultured bacterium]KKP69019.1 MAG: hypothetical protein UR66_C0002G0076 [Candidatus Moranbacteria bacterium GW2011_GWE1_35_17]KKP74393.1 MAG: hypothetical protein UR65_C0001G0010 [Candidatus Moranbacteria bacterium GW2011_GWE2_35_164]KKP84123.1 MAG: hypothetical protein UR82_C0012G0019 [Candidatus Moranbacteria bacterium GW2011_GWF1_35_5]KKP85302.1 MAG: hypothetical protein UR83_C0001G0009 [Candidatus Moranbacteria bacterium GW2011_GWF2_35_54]
MQILLKSTYLLDVKKIEERLDKFWLKYEKILAKPTWKSLNEARAILYLIGQVYCEKIAPKAIEKRLPLLESPMSLVKFLSTVDSGSKEKLKKLRKDKLFAKLEKYYVLVKSFKNKFNGGKYYLDEERFIDLYNSYNPDKKLKIGYRGRYGSKIK